jgi:hypothetical protein
MSHTAESAPAAAAVDLIRTTVEIVLFTIEPHDPEAAVAGGREIQRAR